MQLIRGIHNIKAHHHGCALTIGNFDGVHRGHQAALNQLKKEGERFGLPIMVMLFEPQPLEMFSAGKAPARLTRLRDKIKYLAQARVDYLLCVKFNSHFAAKTAKTFVSELLVKKLYAKLLIIGDDFRFGASREGNFALLHEAGKEYGFKVAIASTIYENGLRISSTAIRHALDIDAIVLAENLLGHPYSISGRVVHGDKVGRTIGFPTANLSLKSVVSPVKGVYAVEVYGIGANPLPGVANIGTRPTLFGVCQQLEVHILDIIIDLYGHHIDVVIRKKLRNEQNFASLDILQQKIDNDLIMARKFFGLKNSLNILQ